jgi:sterol desaturase/sphingolipid hydroxylase (fatty acid hydroxylase superfamily)
MLTHTLMQFVTALLVFVPLEALLPRYKDKKVLRAKWQTDTAYVLAGGLVISMGMTGLFVATNQFIMPLVDANFRAAIGNQPVLLQAVEIIIIADVGYYLIHRMFHQFPFLWRFHAVHHSIEEMDWLAAHRVHPVDQVLTRGVSMCVPLAMGYAPAAFVIFGAFFGWHSLLKHSNVKVSFGPLRWILATPTYHHWHHGNQPEAFDKNFAGQLPIIDILFGTAMMEEAEGPKAYGCDTPVPPDFVGQLAAPFQSPDQKLATLEPSVAK